LAPELKCPKILEKSRVLGYFFVLKYVCKEKDL